MQTRFLEQTLCYNGDALAPHWILKTAGLRGNALVAFVGEADVKIDHMVDQEDVLKNAPIYSPRMLHFIGEWFIDSLDQGILLQHLFTSEMYEMLWESGATQLRKRGNDIYFQDRKMSVSIATRSGVSVLMHAGINVETAGTPVPTAGLAELGIDARTFGQTLLERFSQHYRIWTDARAKVAPRL